MFSNLGAHNLTSKSMPTRIDKYIIKIMTIRSEQQLKYLQISCVLLGVLLNPMDLWKN